MPVMGGDMYGCDGEEWPEWGLGERALQEDFNGCKQVLVANHIGSARYVPEGGD